MKNVMNVLEEVKKTSGKNEKEKILAQYANSPEILSALNFLFNDFVVTGLALKKIQKDTGLHATVRINTLDEAMLYLAHHNTGTDADIANIQSYLNKHNNAQRVFLEQFLSKTYRCGITAKTINKAFKCEFIQEFACQLAHPYSKYSDRVDGEFAITTKLDGHRTIAMVNAYGDATFFTRKGKIVEGLGEITEAIKIFALESNILSHKEYNDGFVLDGEIIPTDLSKIPKNKIFQSTGKIIKKNGEKTGLTLNVFDLIPYGEFLQGESSKTYFERREDMTLFFARNQNKHLILLEQLYKGSDKNVIPELLKQQTGLGEEGIMINLDHTYKSKRNIGLLKVKTFFSADVLVTGIFAGAPQSKYAKMLGGIYIDYKGSKVGVGAGFSDEERAKFYSNPELIIDKVVEVQYFEETVNQKGCEVSLRFPIFKGIREDKTASDVNYEV